MNQRKHSVVVLWWSVCKVCVAQEVVCSNPNQIWHGWAKRLTFSSTESCISQRSCAEFNVIWDNTGILMVLKKCILQWKCHSILLAGNDQKSLQCSNIYKRPDLKLGVLISACLQIFMSNCEGAKTWIRHTKDFSCNASNQRRISQSMWNSFIKKEKIHIYDPKHKEHKENVFALEL